MPLPVIAGVARCSVIGHDTAGLTWVNVFHLQDIGGTWTATSDTNAATALTAIYNDSAFKTLFDVGWATESIKIIPLDGISPLITIPMVHNGSTGGGGLPGGVSIIATWRSTHRGRSYRGRTYFGPAHPSTCDGSGRVTGSAQAAMVGTMNSFLSACSANSLVMGVASYKLGIFTATPVGTIQPAPGRQKRRAYRA